MNELFRLKKFVWYQWKARTKYYIHSPFVYQFFLNVLEGKDDSAIEELIGLRKGLRKNTDALQVTDFGTGKSAIRRISELERGVAVAPKYGKVLFSIVKYFKPVNMLELGTSIGISSAYMAIGNPDGNITTIDGSESLVVEARKHHHFLKLRNIKTEAGDFKDKLPQILATMDSVDMVLFDGNHTREATLGYFKQCIEKASDNSIFIFDDIYWSPEMTQAWEEIKSDKRVKLTIDIYQFGICFFMKENLAKENFILRY
jgi:predicted O-methyltransferase YrrM